MRTSVTEIRRMRLCGVQNKSLRKPCDVLCFHDIFILMQFSTFEININEISSFGVFANRGFTSSQGTCIYTDFNKSFFLENKFIKYL